MERHDVGSGAVMAAPTPPPGFVLDAPAPPPGFALDQPGGPIDLRRDAAPPISTPGVIMDRDWWDQNYQRLGLPQNPSSLDQITEARRQYDPEGQAAYAASPQGRLLASQGTTEGWNQPFDTNNTPIDWLRAAGQGVFGLGDEAEGLVHGIGGLFTGEGFQPAYDRGVTNARTEIGEYSNAHPTASTALGLLGAAPTMLVPGMSAAAKGASLLTRVGRGLVAGAAAGGATGFGLGEGSPAERLPGAMEGAIVGAGAGAALPVVAPLAARALTGRAGGSALAGLVPESVETTAQRSMLGRQPMTTDQLHDAGQAAYQRAADAGVIVTPGAFDDFVLNAAEQARQLGVNHILTPRSQAVLDELFRFAGQQQYTVDDLNILRRVANMAATSIDPADANIGRNIRDGLDNWLASLTPQDIAGGDVAAATAALREARDLWGRYRRSELFDQLQERALNAVGANFSQAGLQTALRQQFRALANSRQFQAFPLDEQQAILDIVRGSPLENTLRRIGVFAPRGFFSTMFAFGGATNGNLPMMGLSVAGEAAKRASGAMTNASVRRLGTLVGGGTPAAAPSFGTQQATLGALMAGQAYALPRQNLIPEEYLPIPAGLR